MAPLGIKGAGGKNDQAAKVQGHAYAEAGKGKEDAEKCF